MVQKPMRPFKYIFCHKDKLSWFKDPVGLAYTYTSKTATITCITIQKTGPKAHTKDHKKDHKELCFHNKQNRLAIFLCILDSAVPNLTTGTFFP